MPLSVLQNKTPYEVLLGKIPNYRHLRSFGCLCYGHVNSKPWDKFAPRAKPSIFVGYPNGQKGTKFMILRVKRSMFLVMFSSSKTSFHLQIIQSQIWFRAQHWITSRYLDLWPQSPYHPSLWRHTSNLQLSHFLWQPLIPSKLCRICLQLQYHLLILLSLPLFVSQRTLCQRLQLFPGRDKGMFHVHSLVMIMFYPPLSILQKPHLTQLLLQPTQRYILFLTLFLILSFLMLTLPS